MELRCCVEYLESKVLVEGKKGNVVAELFLMKFLKKSYRIREL